MSAMKTDYSLQDFLVFNDFNPALIESLLRQGKTSVLEKESVVHTPMEACRSVGFILNGSLRMTKILSSGKEFVIKILSAGQMFGELVCFAENNYPCWIVTTENSTIFEIPIKTILSLCKESDFLRIFMKDISKKCLHLTDTIELLSLKKVDQKLAYTLLSLFEGVESKHLELDTTITELANQIGSSREAVSRSFTELESHKCIKRDGTKILLLNRGKLEDILTG
ncbi:MAG: Crp/Fnr family transcriptional regulator [Bacteroidetes bacterium]|nr:Crp/Fnr family transcriptional regulator [Bacteroidota bacterium]